MPPCARGVTPSPAGPPEVLTCSGAPQVPPQNPSNPSSCSSPCQVPIQESLIEFPDGSISKLATEAFQGRKPQTPCPVGPPSLEKGLDKQIGWLLQPHRPPCSNLGGWGVCHTSPGWGQGELRHRVPFFPPSRDEVHGRPPSEGANGAGHRLHPPQGKPRAMGVVAAGTSPAVERAVRVP